MTYSFSIDRSNLILRAVIAGQITDAELKEFYATARGHAAGTDIHKSLVVFLNVDIHLLSTATIEDLAELPPIVKNPAICVIVVSTDAMYRMARLFQICGLETRDVLHVVRNIKEAYTLLGVENPRFEPLD